MNSNWNRSFSGCVSRITHGWYFTGKWAEISSGSYTTCLKKPEYQNVGSLSPLIIKPFNWSRSWHDLEDRRLLPSLAIFKVDVIGGDGIPIIFPMCVLNKITNSYKFLIQSSKGWWFTVLTSKIGWRTVNYSTSNDWFTSKVQRFEFHPSITPVTSQDSAAM